MPRGHKSKIHAREKHFQAHCESQCLQAEAAAIAAEEALSAAVVAAAAAAAAVVAEVDKEEEEEHTPSSPQSEDMSCPRSDGASSMEDMLRVAAYEALPSNESSDPDDVSRAAQALQQFLLYKYKQKEPIMEKDMLKIIGPCLRNKYSDIISKVSEHIETLFALDMKEVDCGSRRYELVSKLSLPNKGRVHAGRGYPKTALLMIVLGRILVKGNAATEEDIWRFLNFLYIYAGRKHRIYGEPRKLITKDFVRLQYLEYHQVPDSNPPRSEFRWGPKAHAETTKMKVLEFWAKLNGTIPSAFPSSYEEALREEEERGQPRVAGRAATTGRCTEVSTPSAPLEKSEAYYPADKDI